MRNPSRGLRFNKNNIFAKSLKKTQPNIKVFHLKVNNGSKEKEDEGSEKFDNEL